MTPRDYNGLLRDNQKRREDNAFARGLAAGIVVGFLLSLVGCALGTWWLQ